MNKLPLYALLLICFFSFTSNAQTETSQPLSQEQPNNIVPLHTPTELTPEQKIEIRKGLMKNIQNTAVNSDVLERKHLMNAIENLKKIRLRQENLGKPENEQIKYKKPHVNLNNRKDFQKYMQNSYLQDLDTTEKAKALLSPKPTTIEETDTQPTNTTE